MKIPYACAFASYDDYEKEENHFFKKT